MRQSADGLSPVMVVIYTPEAIKGYQKDVANWGPMGQGELLERAVDAEQRRYRQRFGFINETAIVNVSLGKNEQIKKLRFTNE